MRTDDSMKPATISATIRAATAAAILPGAVLFGTMSAAHADTSYLRPNIFTTANADLVTVQSSFTEDFSNPSVAVDSDQWVVVGPDGTKSTFRRVEKFTQVTVLEATTPNAGTYRLSTGERLGRIGKQVKVDGVWTPWSPDREIPEGAETRTSQTATVADVYVTRGAPTQAPVDAVLGRVALKASVHPNDIYLDAPLGLTVLLEGKPVADQDVEIWREGGAYQEPVWNRKLRTDANGAVSLTFDEPGVYLAWTRLSADAPAGAPTQVRSYTTSLTFEVQP